MNLSGVKHEIFSILPHLKEIAQFALAAGIKMSPQATMIAAILSAVHVPEDKPEAPKDDAPAS